MPSPNQSASAADSHDVYPIVDDAYVVDTNASTVDVHTPPDFGAAFGSGAYDNLPD